MQGNQGGQRRDNVRIVCIGARHDGSNKGRSSSSCDARPKTMIFVGQIAVVPIDLKRLSTSQILVDQSTDGLWSSHDRDRVGVPIVLADVKDCCCNLALIGHL